ncbi:hypothetical protein CEK26_013264 [Fusarium fujikuroi]|uniref:Uncharacterized protein n=1 Tax=Fusarium fujikuroi TaxID=5127 RepID=A0A5Q3GA52_FUSFU|nr:hypothetical protein CEK27_013278 [Fusarium fujikuroi]QGI86671.1 hypothetical protein CEK25_013400 [Fusarium fujikuroi]QGJ00196.1 hypothetical protein CEK26_013264 [Fusarium fujikuroi]VTT81377.1 unnamed protein product [Fusarium fujikuroi]VZH94101.1 unnamed protein product [Fusarium fujikuroi]
MTGPRGPRRAGCGRPRVNARPQRAQDPNACVPCQGIQLPCTPTDFLHAHNFSIWYMSVESEERRYSPIKHCLRANLRKSVADQAFYHASYDLLTTNEIPATSLSEEVRNTITENFDQLLNTSMPKLVYLRRALMEPRVVDPRDVSSMLINNQLVQIASQVHVTMGDRLETFRVIQFPFMRRGRWFLGYSPGTFIFRYSNSLPFTEGLDIMPSHMNFTYEGQVPRSSYEHKLRLMALWKPASEIFIGSMTLFLGVYHAAYYPRHAFLRSRVVIDPDTFRQILEDWTSLSRSFAVFPTQDHKDNIWKHGVTQELAWLILRLKDVPEVYEGVQSPDLEILLTAATGLSLQDLAGHWNSRLERMAWEHFHGGNRRDLFIYENEGQSDIWNLYNEQTFQYDCINPSVENNLPRLKDCRAALQPYDRLIQEKLRQTRAQVKQGGHFLARAFNAPFSFSPEN